MFADIKDSTELIRDLDPEAAQQLLDPAIHIMMDAVHRFEGTVNQVLGDGIMAIFGSPVAHEDHAARACYAALAEALAVVAQNEQRYYEAELHRLKGELLLGLAVPDVPQAETCFHQATDVARRQQAKSWEPRADTSLARLWQSQGKRQDAYDLLEPVHGWFTEGFDTADLKEAKALLEGLA